jgi:tetratricopeptide (TPR) repeat protein
LNRIAEAVGTTWNVAFRDESRDVTERGRRRRHLEGIAAASRGNPSSDDPLLEAFNSANTTRQRAAAHAIAQKILREPSTPRRKLALALDAYNEGNPGDALIWAEDALSGDLPELSRDVATLCAARASLALGKPRAALARLRKIRAPQVRWLVEAARAEAYQDAGDSKRAITAAEKAVASAGGAAEAHYLAARIDWHADRPWRALTHISIYRAQEPTNIDGILLNGSILGFLGDKSGDREFWQEARTIFEGALPQAGCEAMRLCGTASARLGDWRGAIRWATKMTGPAHAKHRHEHEISHIVDDALNNLEADADLLEACLNAAERIDALPADLISFHRSFAIALRGDFEGAVEALGLSPQDLPAAAPAAQIRSIVALVVQDRLGEAYPILKRNESELTNPDGLLMLARSALTAGHETTARRVLTKLASSSGPVATTAQIALDLSQVVRRAGAEQFLAQVMAGEAGARLDRLVSVGDSEGAPSETDWEGEHRPGSRVLDRVSVTALLH